MRYLLGWFLSLRTRTKVILGVIILLLALGVVFRRPMWEAFASWRAENLLEEARQYAEDENWEDVERTAMASLQLESSVDAYRLLTEAFVQNREPRILQAAAGLFSHPEATLEDRTRAIEVFLDKKQVVAAAPMVESLDAAEREDPAMHYQLVRFHLMAGNYGKAAEMADAVPAAERNPALDLLLAQGFAASGKEEAKGATAARLGRVLTGEDDNLARQAMRLLAALPDKWISQKLAEKALERFGGNESLPLADRLRLDLFRIGLGVVEREKLVEETIAKNRQEHLEELVAWLARLGEAQRIVDLTDPSRRPEGLSATLFEKRAGALEGLGKLEELKQELEDPPVDIPDVRLLAARAALATKLENESEAVILWQQAFEAAENDPSRNWFYQISSSAARAGLRDRQMEALARAIEHPRGTPPQARQLESLFAWLYETGDIERLLKINYQLLAREPGNPGLVNNYHYLKVLLGEATENDVEVLRRLVETFPDIPQFRSSYALALLKTGQPGPALAALDEIEEPLAERPPADKAVYAAVLAGLGRHDEVEKLAAGIDWDKVPAGEASALQELAKR